jgi:hypothetical protein
LDVEWFFNNESEFWAQFSLYWLLWHLHNVDQVPELVDLASSKILEDLDVGILSVYTSSNLNDLSFLIDELVVLVLEKLEPS